MSAERTDPIVIGWLPKNTREMIRISLAEYKGHRYADVRIFAKTEEGDKPTKSGVTIKLGELDALRDLITKLQTTARELGWLNGGGNDAAASR